MSAVPSPDQSAAPTGGRTLPDDVVLTLADELAEAVRTGVPVPRLTSRHPGMTVEDAYAVQGVWARRRAESGRTVAGHKIGLTSKAMQEATGITEPDYGVIFDDQVLPSRAEVEWARFSHVRVEVELAFQLSSDLTDPCTREDVLAATAYVIPALEILDAHVEMAGRTIVDTISDNAALGAMVLAEERFDPSQIPALEWVPAVLRRNGAIEESGVSGAVLGDPALGVAWLANKLAAHGEHLKAGEIVLAGSFTRPVWVQAGDLIECEYRGLGGSAGARSAAEADAVISCRFS